MGKNLEVIFDLVEIALPGDVALRRETMKLLRGGRGAGPGRHTRRDHLEFARLVKQGQSLKAAAETLAGKWKSLTNRSKGNRWRFYPGYIRRDRAEEAVRLGQRLADATDDELAAAEQIIRGLIMADLPEGMAIAGAGWRFTLDTGHPKPRGIPSAATVSSAPAVWVGPPPKFGTLTVVGPPPTGFASTVAILREEGGAMELDGKVEEAAEKHVTIRGTTATGKPFTLTYEPNDPAALLPLGSAAKITVDVRPARARDDEAHGDRKVGIRHPVRRTR